MKRALLDVFCATRRISWRRLFAFAVATALLERGTITEEAWVMVAIAFIGGEVLQRLAATAYGAPPPPSSESP